MSLEEEVETWLRSQARPSLQLVASTRPTNTFLGGSPSVPPDFEWPQFRKLPMAFLGQVDLGEATAAGEFDFLPKTGRLLFFFDAMQSVWGSEPNDKDGWRVVYIAAAAATVEMALPRNMPPEGLFDRRHMSFEPRTSYPSRDKAVGMFVGPDFDTVYQAILDRLATENTDPRHLLLGWPEPIQHDEMELISQFTFWGLHGMQGTMEHDWVRPGASKWQLLLQLDSDETVGMMWGDVGRLYFFVRRDDAEKADFSKVWMHLQCY